MDKPKPCPFCGGEARVEDRAKTVAYKGDMLIAFKASCRNAACYAVPYVVAPTEARAIAKWNTRKGE